MNFLQSQPETEVVDSAFDFHFVRKPLVTVTNHSNKYIRLKGDCVLSKFLPIQELVNSTDAWRNSSVLGTDGRTMDILRLVQCQN